MLWNFSILVEGASRKLPKIMNSQFANNISFITQNINSYSVFTRKLLFAGTRCYEGIIIAGARRSSSCTIQRYETTKIFPRNIHIRGKI